MATNAGVEVVTEEETEVITMVAPRLNVLYVAGRIIELPNVMTDMGQTVQKTR